MKCQRFSVKKTRCGIGRQRVFGFYVDSPWLVQIIFLRQRISQVMPVSRSESPTTNQNPSG